MLPVWVNESTTAPYKNAEKREKPFFGACLFCCFCRCPASAESSFFNEWSRIFILS